MDRVTDRLYIGGYRDAIRHGKIAKEGIDTVVNLSARREESTDRHHYLLDKRNEQDRFNQAVETVRRELDRGNKVLVHCSAGVSRSAAVTATVLADQKGISFEDAVQQVQDSHPKADPHQGLQENARTYLN